MSIEGRGAAVCLGLRDAQPDLVLQQMLAGWRLRASVWRAGMTGAGTTGSESRRRPPTTSEVERLQAQGVQQNTWTQLLVKKMQDKRRGFVFVSIVMHTTAGTESLPAEQELRKTGQQEALALVKLVDPR